MEKDKVLKTLEILFSEVLDLEGVALTEATSPDEIEEWDSLGHVQLISAIERVFRIKFTALEIINMKSVGAIINRIILHSKS